MVFRHSLSARRLTGAAQRKFKAVTTATALVATSLAVAATAAIGLGVATAATSGCSGLGQANGDISADCYSSSTGTISVTSTTDPSPAGVDSNQVSELSNGDTLEYTGVNFGAGSDQFVARVASGATNGASGLVNVVLDNPSNAPIGNFAVGNTGGWSAWETIPANIATTTGTHNVYLEFSSGQPAAYVSLHYFGFPSDGTTTTATATTTTAATTTTTAATTTTTAGSGFGGFPSSFWGNTSAIPKVTNGIEFNFLNATNGQYPDSEVYWSVNGVTNSVAAQPYYDMTSCSSCRIYFYLGSPTSQYKDFIELNSSGTTLNADTSRVDAFGLPLAVHLHNADGTDTVVGEDYGVFSESCSALFSQFENAVPDPFKQLATVNAPYTIPAPADVAAFQPGGADQYYMSNYAASVGVSATTQQVFACAGTLSGNPNECAALNRCVAQLPSSDWSNPSLYYQNPPCNYYSMFWHQVAVGGKAYGFAYDDDYGQSSDFNTTDGQYVQVAVGW